LPPEPGSIFVITPASTVRFEYLVDPLGGVDDAHAFVAQIVTAAVAAEQHLHHATSSISATFTSTGRG
jgi:hypothetical protein